MCGNLANRHEILALLAELPGAKVLDEGEVLEFIERQRSMGSGLGWSMCISSPPACCPMPLYGPLTKN